jgi:type II secretory pathway pseudopilin PulG
VRLRPASKPPDDGFTLIEAVVAIAIIGIAVVVIVGALAGLIASTQHHRGNVVAESATRNVTQAVVAKTQASTTLSSGIGASAGAATLSVGDASQFGTSGFISVDLEIMRVTGHSATTISVVRGTGRAYDSWPGGDPAEVVSHDAGSPVASALMCAQASEIAPASSQYVLPAGVTVTVSAVEYWDLAAKAFGSDRSTCISQYKSRCTYDDQTKEDLRLDCDAGLQRVTLSTSTAGESRYKGATGSTQFLIRRASA